MPGPFALHYSNQLQKDLRIKGPALHQTLNEIKLLPLDMQLDLLSMDVNTGHNLLMCAINCPQKNYTAIQDILEIITTIQATLGVDAIHPILAQKNQEFYNPITLALKAFSTSKDDKLTPILDTLMTMLEAFSPEQNAAIFYVDSDGNSDKIVTLPMLLLEKLKE